MTSLQTFLQTHSDTPEAKVLISIMAKRIPDYRAERRDVKLAANFSADVAEYLRGQTRRRDAEDRLEPIGGDFI
ncbi:MAG: hypothetical protein Q7R42_06045 [Candidatus Planktophila sp.]|nr:hypothetical protein [Candidatus Planktophila sp.]